MDRKIRLLIPAALAFLICFLLTAFYNRYASDDFEFLYQYRELGFSGSVGYFYDNWNTRWLAIGWMNIVFITEQKLGNLIYYHAFSLFLLWISFYRLTALFLNTTVWVSIVSSFFMSMSFFYCCFSISDVFFWINTSTMYLYGTIAFIFALGAVFADRITVTDVVLLIVAGFYLGASYEPLVFTSMLAAVIYLWIQFRKHGSRVAAKPVVIKVILVLSVLMIAFAISYAGDGHTIRSSFLPQTTFAFKLWVWFKAVIKMVVLELPSKFLIALLFSFPFFLSGMIAPFKKLSFVLFKKVSILFFVLVVISLLPISFIMSEMGPERAWTQISLYLVLYSCFMAAYAGSVLKTKYDADKAVKLYALISLLYVISTGVPEIIKSYYYSNAYEIRMQQLLKHDTDKNDNVNLVLKPLPETGWIHSAEISPDPNHFTNQHLKKYLRLDFQIRSQFEIEK